MMSSIAAPSSWSVDAIYLRACRNNDPLHRQASLNLIIPLKSSLHIFSISTTMSDSGNSSTLGSYVNAASGAAQRAYGAVTGDSSYQVSPFVQ